MSSNAIIKELIKKGLISKEFEGEATRELHVELSRRARRLSQIIAYTVYVRQAAYRLAQLSV